MGTPNVRILFHNRSTSFLDQTIHRLMPKAKRRIYLHVSFGVISSLTGDWEYYTWTHRGLETLDINQASLCTCMQKNYTEAAKAALCRRVMSRCDSRVRAVNLLKFRLGLVPFTETCASLVSSTFFGRELDMYPCELWNYARKEGFEFCDPYGVPEL